MRSSNDRTGRDPRPGQEPGDQLTRAAKGGAITFAGAASSAALGFLFNIVLARELGTEGAGVVLQAVAAFTIVLAMARLGLDTTAVWMLPRTLRTEPLGVPPAVVAILWPAAVVPAVAVVVWFALVELDVTEGADPAVTAAISVAFLFLPVASLTVVGLAVTRALGGVVPFNAVGNITVPALRPLGLFFAVGAGGGTLAAVASWALPWLLGMVLTMLVVLRLLRGVGVGRTSTWRPSRALTREVFGYSIPRMIMASLEQSLIWLDVLLVGILLGSAEAGVYGSAARFVAAGIVVLTALRIVVAPRFSVLLGEQRLGEVEELYTVTARWVLLFGAPVYVLLAVYSPTVLGWLGDGFQEGVTCMVILSIGSIVLLAAGNVQSLLLMSGRSGRGAINRLVVVCFNVAGNLLLLPRIGIEGAAITWAASMALSTLLAARDVHKATGIALGIRSIGATALVVLLCVGTPTLAVERLAGQGVGQLALSAVVGGTCLAVYCVLDRRRLRLDQLLHMRRS